MNVNNVVILLQITVILKYINVLILERNSMNVINVGQPSHNRVISKFIKELTLEEDFQDPSDATQLRQVQATDRSAWDLKIWAGGKTFRVCLIPPGSGVCKTPTGQPGSSTVSFQYESFYVFRDYSVLERLYFIVYIDRVSLQNVFFYECGDNSIVKRLFYIDYIHRVSLQYDFFHAFHVF